MSDQENRSAQLAIPDEVIAKLKKELKEELKREILAELRGESAPIDMELPEKQESKPIDMDSVDDVVEETTAPVEPATPEAKVNPDAEVEAKEEIVVPLKNVKRDGPKYVCPYCKSYYYMKGEGNACRDKCYTLLKGGGKLPSPTDNALDFSDLLNKIEGK